MKIDTGRRIVSAALAVAAVVLLAGACSSSGTSGTGRIFGSAERTGSGGSAGSGGSGSSGDGVRVIASGQRLSLVALSRRVLWAEVQNTGSAGAALEVDWTANAGTTKDRADIVQLQLRPHATTYVAASSTLPPSARDVRATATSLPTDETTASVITAGRVTYVPEDIDALGGPAAQVRISNTGDGSFTLDNGLPLVCWDRTGRLIGIGLDTEDPSGDGMLEPGQSLTQHVPLDPTEIGRTLIGRCAVYTDSAGY